MLTWFSPMYYYGRYAGIEGYVSHYAHFFETIKNLNDIVKVACAKTLQVKLMIYVNVNFIFPQLFMNRICLLQNLQLCKMFIGH